jgi:hypothetical protein
VGIVQLRAAEHGGRISKPFPKDFSKLPSLSFVVPNEQDDMHDGSIAKGRCVAGKRISTHMQWAPYHNSLFIVTTDEDDHTNNRIATIFTGANVIKGT